MFVKWDPEDGSAIQEWVFDQGDVRRKDATQVEKHFGGSWDQFIAGLLMGNINARTALLWYMMKQVHSAVKFEDIPDFRVRQLTVEQGVQELKELWKRAQRIKLDADQREAFNFQFEEDMKEAMRREGMDPSTFRMEGKQIELEGAPDLPKSA